MTHDELTEILRLHSLWLTNDPSGKRADLSEADLSEADLSGADLRWTDLIGADLREANLRWTDLIGADLREANLTDADLTDADLTGADLREANLYGASLYGANLSKANLSKANLSGADPHEADLTDAKGFRVLTQTDHGYLVYASQTESGEWRIRAGCRDFSIAEARAHWGSPNYHTPSSGRRVLACIDWFEKETAQ